MKKAKRRLFLQAAGSSGLLGVFGNRVAFGHDRLNTPSQTKGPFYPIPEIEKQQHFDFDLTRKNEDSPSALGEMISIAGSVISHSERPLGGSIVEVWQACETGRYNHPQDKNDRPMDVNFQYWGRVVTGEDAKFRFKTILPGKYPGRTPHIHFRIIAKDLPELVTQLYFAHHEELNRKDNLYMSLNIGQRDAVTTTLEKTTIDAKKNVGDTILSGNFTIVLGALTDTKSTRPM
jgi:protocatechuate 3,4-dioxygenase beta subunit